jgi:hypothetical protein
MKKKLYFVLTALVLLVGPVLAQVPGKHLSFTFNRFWANDGVFRTDNVIETTGASNTLKASYDPSQYFTLAVSSAGVTTLDTVGTTGGFAFSDPVSITGLFTQKYDAAAYWTATQADGAGVTFNSTSDGTAGFTFSDPVTISGLTSGRIPIAGASGLIGDDADLSFSTDTLTATKVSSGEVLATGLMKFSGTPQTLTGAGAVNVTASITWIVTTAADALTLADGAEGQVKIIVMKTDGGDGTLTPAHPAGFATLTFNDVGDSVWLIFTNGAWHLIGNNGATVA